MNILKDINTQILYIKLKNQNKEISGDFSNATVYSKSYINANTGLITTSSAYNIYAIPIPSFGKTLIINQVAISSTLYGMGFASTIKTPINTTTIVSPYNRTVSTRTLKIPTNAKFFLITATTKEIDSFSYTIK